DEPGRRDADDGEAAAVDDYTLAHQARVSAETLLETSVTNDRDRMRARRAIIFRRDKASERRLHAQHLEVIARDQIAPHALIDPLVAQADRRHSISEQPRHDLVAVAQVFVVEIREDRE